MGSTFKSGVAGILLLGATLLLGAALLLAASAATAAPVRYEWTADNFLLSANRDLLETVTGQGSVFADSVGLWATTGGAFGSFVYDSEAALDFVNGSGQSIYTGSTTDWTSVMYGAGAVEIGTVNGEIGRTLVADGTSSAGGDLISVQACLPSCGEGYTGFTVGPWLSTFSGTSWFNGEFLSSQDLPGVLPPPGAETGIAVFGFLDENNVNAQILAGGLQIVSATPVPEPPVLLMLLAGLVGLVRRLRVAT